MERYVPRNDIEWGGRLFDGRLRELQIIDKDRPVNVLVYEMMAALGEDMVDAEGRFVDNLSEELGAVLTSLDLGEFLSQNVQADLQELYEAILASGAGEEVHALYPFAMKIAKQKFVMSVNELEDFARSCALPAEDQMAFSLGEIVTD